MPEAPGHKGHGGADRFQRPGRLGDDEPPGFARMHLHQLVDDRIDMPVVKIGITGRDSQECLDNKGAKILLRGNA